MTRSIFAGLLGLVSVAAIGVLPLGCQSGGIGDPCTPEDEYNANFAGFKMTEENIESRSFQCASRICLVNHFQGRVTCPAGQARTDGRACSGKDDTTTCGSDAKGKAVPCVATSVLAPACTSDAFCASTVALGSTCDKTAKSCVCDTNTTAPAGYSCVLAEGSKTLHVLTSFLCHKANNCQDATKTMKENAGRDCCVPGTDKPVTAAVCGQCPSPSRRRAEEAVYCSCRCDVANKEDGSPGERDPNFHYCDCPTGFSCEQIRPDISLGDQQLTGKYCIKEGTKYNQKNNECGAVPGSWSEVCAGTPGSP